MGKLLTVLGVTEENQNKLPQSVFTAEKVIDGLQAVYAKAPNSPKKDQLAVVIAETVRILLAKVQPYLIDEKKEEEVKKEIKELPREDEPKQDEKKPEEHKQPPKKQDKKPPKTTPEHHTPKPKKEQPKPEEEVPLTCDELKDAIKGLNLIAKMGDEEAVQIIKDLKIKLKKQNCK